MKRYLIITNSWYKVLVLFTLFTSLSLCSIQAGVIPKDMPTIEALIALHKTIKSNEDNALAKVAVSFGEQSLITKGATKFNDVRTGLDTRLNNACSYVILGTTIASTGMALYKMVDEYKDFTEYSVGYAKKKPMTLWYFTEANIKISKEIKHIKSLYVTLAATSFNIARSTMQEKMDLVYSVKASIERIRHIIRDAHIWCKVICERNFKVDPIYEILNSDVRDDIVKGLVTQWNKI